MKYIPVWFPVILDPKGYDSIWQHAHKPQTLWNCRVFWDYIAKRKECSQSQHGPRLLMSSTYLLYLFSYFVPFHFQSHNILMLFFQSILSALILAICGVGLDVTILILQTILKYEVKGLRWSLAKC